MSNDKECPQRTQQKMALKLVKSKNISLQQATNQLKINEHHKESSKSTNKTPKDQSSVPAKKDKCTIQDLVTVISVVMHQTMSPPTKPIDFTLKSIMGFVASDTKLPQYNNIFDQIKGKFILCGDFNAHHTMWGGKHTDTKGRELFSFLEYKDIVLLNDGTGTRCNPSTLELAPIDLSFCNSSLASKITWSVDLTSSYGSDHHVVNINFSHKQMQNDETESVYNYKKADWEAFSSKCNEHLSPDMISDNIEETCSRLTNKILQIAGECIPVKLKNNKPKKTTSTMVDT
ncbi:Hypothetical predicted protein [Mytilus galloprovincialis]|uniref:Endonuclease/exonuclease/phosphatase domain-containing protein n=1 Tax=Mytilus galloprovincialis TaxID=29158 RepID=A0A8B6GQ35_MYTGA|nr:Hypothetical predicted protein [Mytilus galloprovincialis]